MYMQITDDAIAKSITLLIVTFCLINKTALQNTQSLLLTNAQIPLAS